MPTITKLYTMEEASQHNTNEDCWITIDGKVGFDLLIGLNIAGIEVVSNDTVSLSLSRNFPHFDLGVYDVSSYLDEHPGGDDVLLRATGKDATEEFEDAGHSKTARELMEQFCIGELEEMSAPIPEMEIVSMKQELNGLMGEVLKAKWVVPFAVVGLSVAVGCLYLRKK
ncbi:hypothetical protein OROMI_010080 [Orobanche minor]